MRPEDNLTSAGERLREARDRGCAYLLGQQRPDGGFGPPERGLADYYKVPAAWLVCGETGAASRLCQWIRRYGITAEGDFGPRLPETIAYYYLYYNTWVVTGAHRLGQFDLSQKGMDFVLRFQDCESGGFFSSPSERSADTEQDLWVVAGAAQAALYTGRVEAARGAGPWLKKLLELQPDFPRRLYCVYSRARGLYTRFEPSEAIRYVVCPEAESDQYFFQPGIAGGFLASLYRTTGEAEWLRLAREYLRFAEPASDAQFRSLRAGKVGWAAAQLYTLTGESKYRDMALRVGENLIASQGADGAWATGLLSANDATAEMVVWLDEIHQAVSPALAAAKTTLP